MRVALLALLLTGCATAPPANVVTFDRTAFALHYGKLYVRLEDACSGPAPRKLDAATCTDLRAQARVIERALLATPADTSPTIDMGQVMELLGIFAGAAK